MGRGGGGPKKKTREANQRTESLEKVHREILNHGAEVEHELVAALIWNHHDTWLIIRVAVCGLKGKTPGAEDPGEL